MSRYKTKAKAQRHEQAPVRLILLAAWNNLRVQHVGEALGCRFDGLADDGAGCYCSVHTQRFDLPRENEHEHGIEAGDYTSSVNDDANVKISRFGM